MIFHNFSLSESWFCTLSRRQTAGLWFDHQRLWVLLMVPIPVTQWTSRMSDTQIVLGCLLLMQVRLLLGSGNSLRSSDAYMRQHNIPTLLQIMACRLFGAKPLSEPMPPCCQLDPKEHISVKFCLKFKSFHSRKCTSKCRLRNGGHFVLASMC